MAASLRSLIRLNEWSVDDKRRRVGELLRLLDNLEKQGVRLEEELVDEQKVARDSPREAGFLYGNYAEDVIDRRQRIAEAVGKMEMDLAKAREELNEAFRELKKYEVAQKNRDKLELIELAREEQAELDEIATKDYLRLLDQGKRRKAAKNN
ncbi:MAG: flagellar export protein FliJ [Rhodospirillales bacterium]